MSRETDQGNQPKPTDWGSLVRDVQDLAHELAESVEFEAKVVAKPAEKPEAR